MPTRRSALVARLASDFPREHEPCPIGSDRALDTALITAPEARDKKLLKKLDAVAGRVLKRPRSKPRQGSPSASCNGAARQSRPPISAIRARPWCRSQSRSRCRDAIGLATSPTAKSAAAGRLHVAVDNEIAGRSAAGASARQPGLVRIGAITEQQQRRDRPSMRAAVVAAEMRTLRRLPRARARCAAPELAPSRTTGAGAAAATSSGCACGDFERINDGHRMPRSTSMRDDVEGIVAAADHRHVRAQVGARLAGCGRVRRCTRPAPPSCGVRSRPGRATPRPESRPGGNHDGRADK